MGETHTQSPLPTSTAASAAWRAWSRAKANNVPIGIVLEQDPARGPHRAQRGRFRPVSDVEDLLFERAVPALREPECVTVCPTRRLHKFADGTVQIDKAKCIGCQFCVMACPYGVRYLNEEERVVEKCTLCEQITAQGELPQCVSQCGGSARFYGDADEGIEPSRARSGGDVGWDNL